MYSFYVSSFPTGHPPTVDSSIFLLPYLPPPLFILPLSFSRPLTSLRSFLLCEYFPSLLLSFLPRKENPRRCFSLSLSALIRTWCRSRREIFEISRLLCPPPPRGSPQLLCFRPIKMSRKLMIHPPPFTILSRYPLYIFFLLNISPGERDFTGKLSGARTFTTNTTILLHSITTCWRKGEVFSKIFPRPRPEVSFLRRLFLSLSLSPPFEEKSPLAWP